MKSDLSLFWTENESELLVYFGNKLSFCTWAVKHGLDNAPIKKILCFREKQLHNKGIKKKRVKKNE